MVLQQLLLTNEASHSETLVTAFFSNHGHLPVTGSCNFHAWVPAAAGEFPGPAIQKRAGGPLEPAEIQISLELDVLPSLR